MVTLRNNCNMSCPARFQPNTAAKSHMMNTQLATTLCLTLSCSIAAADCCSPAKARRSVCQPTPTAVTCGSVSHKASGPTTKWFKAKDGTIREVMTHWEALHRAVEADQMEGELTAVKSELEASTNQLAAMKSDMEAKMAAMQQQLANMQAKLADRDSQLAKLKKANSQQLAKVKNESQKQLTAMKQKLASQSDETKAMIEANKKLNTKVASLEASKSKDAKALKALRERNQAMKQQAIEAKKAEVAKNKKEQAKKEQNKNKGKDKKKKKKPEAIEEQQQDEAAAEQLADESADDVSEQ